MRFTAWRILTSALLLGLGIPKAVAAYNGQTTVVNTLDWAWGVACAFMYVRALALCASFGDYPSSMYWGGVVEQDSPESVPWLFERDLRQVLGTGVVVIFWAVFCVAGQCIISILTTSEQPTF